MSSHHIVRDQQEPALIFHKITDFPHDSLEQMLEWSPTIICCGSVLEQVLELGIKIDIAILPFESKDSYKDLLSSQAPLKILTLSQPDYLANGLQLLHEEGQTCANIITDGASVPEVLDLCRDFVNKIQLSIWDEVYRYTIVHTKLFSKWFPKGADLEFFNLEESATLSVEDETGKVMEHELVSCKEGKIKITCSQPPFVMVEKIDS